MIGIIKEANVKSLICDIRSLKGPKDNLADAYIRTRNIPLNIRRLSAAVVDSSKDIDYISFYEMTAANAGQTLKWFTDIEAARAWLRSRL